MVKIIKPDTIALSGPAPVRLSMLPPPGGDRG